MLHHHEFPQVTSEHRLQREGEAEAQRLVLEGTRQPPAPRLAPRAGQGSSGSCWHS